MCNYANAIACCYQCAIKKISMWTMQNVTYLMQVGSGNTARIFSCRTFDCSGPCFVVLCFPSIISVRILSPCRENSDCLYLLIFVASWTRRPIDVSSPLLIISNSFSYLFFYADNKRSSCSRGRFVLGNGWSQGGFPVCFLFSYLVVLICDYRFAVFTVVECKWISFQMYLPMHRHHRRRCV